MKRVGILAGIVIILLAGGVFTSQLFSGVPIIVQSDLPDASPFEATPQQAGLIIFWVGFVVFNIVGAGLTLAFVMWRGSVEVKRAQAMPERETESDAEQLPAGDESAGNAQRVAQGA